MVVYSAKVIKNEIVTGGEYHPYPIEIWTTFSVKEKEIEAFLGLPPFDSQVDGTYDVDFRMMTYDLYRVNIEEKMLKQISTFPMDPIYIAVGKVEGYDRENKKILFDCGILLECDTKGKALEFWAKRIKVGDWIYVKGKMFGEIVGEGN